MLKRFIHIGLIFLIVAIGYYGLIAILIDAKVPKESFLDIKPKYLKRSIFERNLAEMDTIDYLDYLMLGSSHCYRGIDPVYFQEKGLKVYNLGNTSQTPLNSYCLLKHYLHKTDKVILEIYPIASAISAIESYYDMSVATNSYSLLLSNAWEIAEFRPYQIVSLKPFINKELQKDKLGKCVFHSGYVQVLDSAKNKHIKYDTLKLDKANLDKSISYIKKMTHLCKQANKEFILVYSPVPHQLVMINEYYFIQKIYELVAQEQITFYNYGRKHSLKDRNDFYDDDHLNATGVKKFNELFLKELLKK